MKKKNKLVYGVGRNDADYRVQEYITLGCENGKQLKKLVWICPFYVKWKDMLKRCYCKKYQERQPTYKLCSVCKEWLTFSNFKKWMEQQYWQGRQLDKDVLFPGSKIYSPDTCVFVDQRVNKFLTERQNDRGQYMIGASWDKQSGRFKADCSNLSGTKKPRCFFDTELEAHKAWLECKLKIAYLLASEQTDPRVAEALIERYENYDIGVDMF